MNILIYSKPYWPSIGGVESGSRILARILAESGHSVRVFTSTANVGSELDEGYEVHRSESLVTFVRAVLGVDLLLMKGGISAFAGLGAILARVPAMVIWHEMAGPYGHPGRNWDVRLANVARKMIARRANVHVGLTQTCLESKRLPRGIKQRVIPTPVDEELLTAAGASNCRHRTVDILFVGRLIEGKGILVLAEALRRLSVDGRAIRVRIVGAGGDRGRMETALRDMSMMSVTFTGNQTGCALADSFASSRILVVPSTIHPEGQAIVVAEGMAFGLAVIVSDQAVLKEVVGDAGIIVPNGDAEALASTLRKLLRDQDYWKQQSDRARQRAEFFSMSNFQQNIADLMVEVANYSQN